MIRPTRRRILQSFAVGLAGFAGCSGSSGIPAPDCSDEELVHETDAELDQAASWPMHQYDSGKTGYNPDVSGTKDEVELAWRYPGCIEAGSGVAVCEGKVSAGGLLVNGRSGQRVGGEWDGHAGTPAFADGRLYVGAHDLFALNAETGEREWTFETESDSGGLGIPAVVDGTVFSQGQFDDPTVYAANGVTGEEEWRFELAAESRFPLAADEQTVYVIDETSTIYAIEAGTGKERWERSLTAKIERSTPVLSNGELYLGTGEGDVLVLDADSGIEIWRREVGSGSVGPVAVAEESLFLPGPDGSLIALSASNGDEKWRQSVQSGFSKPPVIADGIVYTGADATLYALDASTGEERWQFETREVMFGDYTQQGINTGLAVVDDLIYVGTAPGDLYVLQEI